MVLKPSISSLQIVFRMQVIPKSPESQAFKLFSECKSLLEVAIALDELAKYDELQNLQWKVEYLRNEVMLEMAYISPDGLAKKWHT
jgi:hypothetical protein